MPKERVLVVGAGSISRAWFPALQQERLTVAAVVDLKRRVATARLKEFDIEAPVHTDLRKAIREAGADFMLDLTVPAAHGEVTCTALKAGLPVIGEKPMASTLAEARRMVRTAEKTGTLYMVSQSRRWDRRHDSIRRTIAAGGIGRLSSVGCEFFIGPHFGGFRDKMPSPLLLDMAIHQFDLARMMTGRDAERVYTVEYNPHGSWFQGHAAAACVFEMTGGVVFNFNGSWAAEGCATTWNGHWRFAGSKGSIVYGRDETPRGEIAVKKRQLLRPAKKLRLERSPLRHEGFRGALREMLAHLRQGTAPQSECHDNIRSLAMVFAAIEAGRKRRRVAVRA